MASIIPPGNQNRWPYLASLTSRLLPSSLLFMLLPGLAYAAQGSTDQSPGLGVPSTLVMAFLVPIGLTLLAIGGARQERAADVAAASLAAVALSLIGYLVSGFALQYGGIGLVSSTPGMETFLAEWSPLDARLGPGWGVLGLQGFLLRDPTLDTRAYAFFLIEWLPVLVATLIPMLALAGKVPNYMLKLLGLLTSGIIYPLFGNWVWGGGWLANLGRNLGWGHGLVDFAGAASIFMLGGGLALAGIWAFRLRGARASGGEPVPMPPLHFPLFMIIGSFLTLAGWLAMAVANPLAMAGDVHPTNIAGNLLFAAAGGVLLPLLYTWFVTGKQDALMTARGMVAGLVAISASAAFVPTWAAFVIGAIAGLSTPLISYAISHLGRWDDELAVAATFVVPGLWGLLALGLFASGRWGIGWNGTGLEGYLGVASQGVTGCWPDTGFRTDWPDQLQAQLAGALAALALSCALPYIALRIVTHTSIPLKALMKPVRLRIQRKPRPSEETGDYPAPIEDTSPAPLGGTADESSAPEPGAPSRDAATAESEATDEAPPLDA